MALCTHIPYIEGGAYIYCLNQYKNLDFCLQPSSMRIHRASVYSVLDCGQPAHIYIYSARVHRLGHKLLVYAY